MTVPDRFEPGPRPMRAGIDRLLKHLRAPTTPIVQSVFADWPALVGDLVGAHTRPIEVVDGRLTIEVDDPAWAAELRWLADELVERIQTGLGTREINEIHVRIARGNRGGAPG